MGPGFEYLQQVPRSVILHSSCVDLRRTKVNCHTLGSLANLYGFEPLGTMVSSQALSRRYADRRGMCVRGVRSCVVCMCLYFILRAVG